MKYQSGIERALKAVGVLAPRPGRGGRGGGGGGDGRHEARAERLTRLLTLAAQRRAAGLEVAPTPDQLRDNERTAERLLAVLSGRPVPPELEAALKQFPYHAPPSLPHGTLPPGPLPIADDGPELLQDLDLDGDATRLADGTRPLWEANDDEQPRPG